MGKLVIEIENDTKKALKDLAYQQGKTMKALLSELISEVLKKG